ncbi:unnamed protein product [Symbiodinium sp. CCMP2592]|nr:unnamed protein product [Symbiodinium sp. CCMP2592]
MAGKGQGGMQSWWCQPCRQWRKATALYCPQCGNGGSGAQNAGYVHNTWWPDGWQTDHWNQGYSQQMPKSPRRKSPRRAPWITSDNEGGKGKGKGKGKKGHPGTGDGQITAAVPRSDALPAPPVGQITAPSQLAGTKQSTGQAVQTTAERQLEQLVVALQQSNAELPPGVAEIVSHHAQSSTKQAAKSLHKTVTMQTTARSNLEQLRTQRKQYVAGWTTYLASVTSLLTQQFQKQEATMVQFEEAERAWMDQLSEATSQLARLAKEGQAQGSIVEEVAGSSSEDDMDAEESHAEQLKEQEARELHREKCRQLLETLTAAQENSEALSAAAERSGSRTPRRSSRVKDKSQGMDPTAPVAPVPP